MRLLCAAFGAAFLALAAPAVAEEATDIEINPFDILRGGGNILVMRHASSSSDQKAPVGMSKDCQLGEGRGLDAKGLFQARALGELLRAEAVPVLKAYTSRMCRAWDTAALVSGGALVVPSDSQMTTDPAKIAEFKKVIEAELAAHPGQNIILSSHSNIAPLYGAKAAEGEAEVPEGAIFVVRPQDWKSLMRIEIHVDVGAQAIIVE